MKHTCNRMDRLKDTFKATQAATLTLHGKAEYCCVARPNPAVLTPPWTALTNKLVTTHACNYLITVLRKR